MNISSEAEITKIIESDTWMMDVLRAAESQGLLDWWIGAGFLRNKVWDAIEGIKSAPTRDVDLVYYDLVNCSAEDDWRLDEQMAKEYPFAEWEVRNQARMHYKNGLEPFFSTADGISHWIETATCTAVKLEAGKLRYLFCYGTDDLLGMVARPIAYYADPLRIDIFRRRVDEKRWRERWPHLVVEERPRVYRHRTRAGKPNC